MAEASTNVNQEGLACLGQYRLAGGVRVSTTRRWHACVVHCLSRDTDQVAADRAVTVWLSSVSCQREVLAECPQQCRALAVQAAMPSLA